MIPNIKTKVLIKFGTKFTQHSPIRKHLVVNRRRMILKGSHWMVVLELESSSLLQLMIFMEECIDCTHQCVVMNEINLYN